MLALALKYWQIAVGALIAFIIAYSLHLWDVSRIEAKNQETLQNQIKADLKQCSDSKQITTDVSHDYQTKLADLNLELIRLRQRPAKCLPVSRPAPRCDAAPTSGELPTGDGVDTGFLIDFSGRCEQTRQQLLACQSFILRERSTK